MKQQIVKSLIEDDKQILLHNWQTLKFFFDGIIQICSLQEQASINGQNGGPRLAVFGLELAMSDIF